MLAAGAPSLSLPVCPILDAKQKNVYAARYDVSGAQPAKSPDFFLGPIIDWLPSITQPALFLGDGCALYRDAIIRRLGDKAHFAPPDTWWPRVGVLARLGSARFQAGQRDDPAHLLPLYLYPLDCSVRGPDRLTAVLPKTTTAVAK